ncbi:MAG: F0F1 ATP synthase subunit epsilon [Phycisphaeraceae bacterium]|nr:F0F1 ATP synthase subunit epsilon [Phycisphaeraceae bacterium]MCW5753748.1 F0F1 ATP synthase subunit epsilon [Phycisphaeraceae bacterium]
MAKKTFRCRVVTPTAKLLDDQATYASIPAWDGLFGVLPGRSPIVAKLGVGALTVEFPDSAAGGGGRRTYFIDGGFVRMSSGELTILADRAAPAEQLTVTDAETELKAAENLKIPTDAKDRARWANRIAHERHAARTKLRIAQSAKGKAI